MARVEKMDAGVVAASAGNYVEAISCFSSIVETETKFDPPFRAKAFEMTAQCYLAMVRTPARDSRDPGDW